MSDNQTQQHFQVIRRHISILQRDSISWIELDALLEDLQVTYEHMQACLEAAEVVEEELFQQKQYYQDLFQFFPIASLVTNASGLILEVNQETAQLLNVSFGYLIGKPLAVFVVGADRASFWTHLNQLSVSTGIQIWPISLCPCRGEPFAAELHVAVVRNTAGKIENLRIGLYNLSRSQSTLPSAPKRTS